MADFISAFHKTMVHEGFYADHPADRGGETYRGIARNFHPDWPGWETIEGMKAAGQIKGGKLLIAPSTTELSLNKQVMEFYFSEYWMPLKLEEFKHQLLAEKVFDVAVNCGLKKSAEMLQQALNVVMGAGLDVDGKVGPLTLRTVNGRTKRDAETIETFFRVLLGYHYIRIIYNNPTQRTFVHGWGARVLS